MRPEKAPLADRIAAPVAMSTLPDASMRADLTCRTAAVVNAGFAPRSTRHADHAAPAKMTVAGTADPTAARIRGSEPKCSLPVGIVCGSIVPLMGATITTPTAKPEKTRSTSVVPRPARSPARRWTVPSPSHGTLTTAPNAKNIRNDALLHPRDSAHQSDIAATTNNPMAIVQASSCGRWRLVQRSRVLKPKARATMADAAASAVLRVTSNEARRSPAEFVKA